MSTRTTDERLDAARARLERRLDQALAKFELAGQPVARQPVFRLAISRVQL